MHPSPYGWYSFVHFIGSWLTWSTINHPNSHSEWICPPFVLGVVGLFTLHLGPMDQPSSVSPAGWPTPVRK